MLSYPHLHSHPSLFPASIQLAWHATMWQILSFHPVPPQTHWPSTCILSFSGHHKQRPQWEDGPDTLLSNPGKVFEYFLLSQITPKRIKALSRHILRLSSEYESFVHAHSRMLGTSHSPSWSLTACRGVVLTSPCRAGSQAQRVQGICLQSQT